MTLLSWITPTVPSALFIYMYDVLRGQIWRLITPIFIHFDVMHILFNMWMLRDLGDQVIEEVVLVSCR